MTWKRLASIVSVVFLVPLTTSAKTFRQIVEEDIVPLGDQIIYLLYAVAFLFFLFGMARTFFSYNPETREKGKQFAAWGIIALFVLFAVWGIVRLLLGVLGGFNT
jgi:hypothetical protein